MFEGKVEKSTGGGIEIATGDGFVVKADVADAPAAGSPVWFALRPEKFKVSKEAGKSR